MSALVLLLGVLGTLHQIIRLKKKMRFSLDLTRSLSQRKIQNDQEDCLTKVGKDALQPNVLLDSFVK